MYSYNFLGVGAFSEAILEYCANIENAPYPDITKDRFSGEIFTAFEIMFGVWMNSSKEARVRKIFVNISNNSYVCQNYLILYEIKIKVFVFICKCMEM